VRISAIALVACSLAAATACQDELGFSTRQQEVYTGEVIDADFLRARPPGSALLEPGTTMDLTLNMRRLDEDPGVVSTSDGLLDQAELVALPAITFDRLSALEIPGNFLRSLVFLAPTSAPEAGGADAILFISLAVDGQVEARVLVGNGDRGRLYGVYKLARERVEDELP